DGERRAAAGALAQTGDELGEALHLPRPAERARSARVDEHEEAADLLRPRLDGRRDAHDGEVAVAQPGAGADAVLRDDEVAVGRPRMFAQRHDATVAHLDAV